MTVTDKYILIGWAIGMGQSLVLLAVLPWLGARLLKWMKHFDVGDGEA